MKHKTNFFNQHPDLYDLMIPWEQRLSREIPFFEKIFSKHNVKSVVDCGCGTGWHTISFSKLGLKSFGLDSSDGMLQRAKLNAKKENSTATFIQGDFKSVDKSISQKVDAVICLGNSLAIMKNESEIKKTLKSMNRVLTPKGIVVFQVVNFQRMPKNEITPLPVRSIQKDGKEFLFIRLFDVGINKVKINFVMLSRENNQWSQETNSTHLFYYTQPLLKRLLKESGFNKIKIYGDMSLNQFFPKISPDFIVIAEK